MLALIYVLFAWMVQSASKAGNELFEWWPDYAVANGLDTNVEAEWDQPSLMELLSELHPGHFPRVLHAFWDVLSHSPSSSVLALLVVFGLLAFRRSAGTNIAGGLAGAVHGLAHLVLACWLVWAFSWINLTWLELDMDSLWQVVLFLAEMLVFGGLLGAWLFGVYLTITSRISGAHMNEVFSSQSIPHRKSFLRLRIEPDGGLTVHPVGVPEVPVGKDWSYRGDDHTLQPGEPWFEPPEGGIRATLIEKPFRM